MSKVPAGDRLPAGKLPAAELEAALERVAGRHPRLIAGPRVGEDAAVIETGPRRIVVTADPITFATDRIGWYAVHVNANDVAVVGARPAWFFAVVLMPEGCDRAAVHAILDDISQTCRALGVVLAGGHTEITTGLARPIVVGQMIGEAAEDEVVMKSGLAPGDLVIATYGAAIEGTALLAREMAAALDRRLGSELVARAGRLLFDPGISVLPAAGVATAACRVHAMHDPTEGGMLTALHEMASAAGAGMRVWADRIPVLPETRAVCDALGVDPMFLLASGALIVGVSPSDAPALLGALEGAGIPAALVAEACPPGEGIEVQRQGAWSPLSPAARDEVARILAG